MAEKSRALVELAFQDGGVISSWTSFTLRDTYTDPLGSLEFTTQPPRARVDEYRKRLAKGQLATLKINGISQGGFLIQTLTTKVGMDGVTFSATCQTPLVTAFQGGVDPDLSAHSQTDVEVTNIVLRALIPYGFDTVAADSSANVDIIAGKQRSGKKKGTRVESLKHQDAQAHPGESAYAFCARIFTRLGVCMRMAADGALLIGSPDYEQHPSFTVAQTFGSDVPGADMFIGDVEIVDTNDDQFSRCVVRGARADTTGQKQTSRPAGVAVTTDLSQLRPPYTSDIAAPQKPLYIEDKNARDIDRAKSVAKLALGIRAKDAFTVTGEVDGMLTRDGAIWQVDTVGRVVVKAYGLDQPMWLLERTFSFAGLGAGQKTRLKLIPLGFLTLGDIPS